jgi:hypothetical protein
MIQRARVLDLNGNTRGGPPLTLPKWPTMMYVIMWSGAGGGGAGFSRAAGSPGGGGGGGSSSCVARALIPLSMIGRHIYCRVGIGGAPGAAGANSVLTTDPLYTQSLITCNPGGAGGAGTASAAGAGGTAPGVGFGGHVLCVGFSGTSGAAGGAHTGAAGVNGLCSFGAGTATAGAGGGGCTTTDFIGGSSVPNLPWVVNGFGGAVGGGNGQHGSFVERMLLGSGGGGGGSNNSGTGGKGGDGAMGCGGGGGGAGVTGGLGGSGGDGRILIYYW